MAGKIAIVTGSNCGVGYETAKNLVLRGATVVLACRARERGSAAVSAIEASIRADPSCSGRVMFLQLDLESFESIYTFVTEFRGIFQRLDILVNNGGINTSGVTSYGLQQTFCVNYLGHYYLFRLLEPLLATKDQSGTVNFGRVVNLSSVMHHVGSPDFKSSAYFGTRPGDLNANNNTYSDSKLYMNFLTMEINRRYCVAAPDKRRRSITAVSVNPGAVRSSIWRAIPWPLSVVYDICFMRPFYLSTKQGAASSIMACSVSNTELFNVDDFQVMGDGVQSSSRHNDSGVKFCGHIFLPYIVPYRCCLFRDSRPGNVPAGLIPSSGYMLALECLGGFSGAQWSRASIPESGDVKATALWNFSEDLVLEMSGKQDAFLMK